MRHLVLAGGVALNCVANGRILAEGIFDGIWIQPAAGDAGGALGAALFTWHQLLDKPRTADGVHDEQQGSLLGPRFDGGQIAVALDAAGATYHRIECEEELLDAVARQIADEKIVGWMQGRMEFGPRALGSRSILGDPRSPRMQSMMNLKTKFRESFRPFAPAILHDHAHDYFALPPGHDSPYMLIVADVLPQHRLPANGEASGIDRLLKVVRSTLPAITHVDCSARIQTADPDRHGRFHRLLQRFHQITGCPVLVNTSFNIRGEPIVCGPAEAYRCFMATNMEVLVIEEFILYKNEQPAAVQHEIDQYLAQTQLD